MSRAEKMFQMFEKSSLEEVGKAFGVSKQRVQQILAKYHKDYTVNRYKKMTPVLASQRELFSRRKYYAKSKGLPWDISFNDIEWPSRCPFAPIPIDYLQTTGPYSPTFLLLDKKKGYVPGNVHVVSRHGKKSVKKLKNY